MFTFHVMMEVLAGLYYARRHALARETEPEEAAEAIEVDPLPVPMPEPAK